jgi:hypothetical protein
MAAVVLQLAAVELHVAAVVLQVAAVELQVAAVVLPVAAVDLPVEAVVPPVEAVDLSVAAAKPSAIPAVLRLATIDRAVRAPGLPEAATGLATCPARRESTVVPLAPRRVVHDSVPIAQVVATTKLS